MILDAWFWTGLVIGAVSFVVCVVMTAIRRHPADASILSVAAVELFTLLDARCPATLVHNLPDSVTGGAGMLLRLSENMDHPKTPSVCGNSKLGS
ncbi:hypothetical protein R0K18_23640 [Pantoea sp. SIMBA_133]